MNKDKGKYEKPRLPSISMKDLVSTFPDRDVVITEEEMKIKLFSYNITKMKNK